MYMTEYDEEYAADLEMIALANLIMIKLTILTTNAFIHIKVRRIKYTFSRKNKQ